MAHSGYTRERDVEAALTKWVRSIGGCSYKWVSPGNDGVPDRIVILYGCPAIFVELKTVTGVLSEIQKRQLNALADNRQPVVVVYGMRGLEEFKQYCRTMMETGVSHDGVRHLGCIRR